MDEREIDELIRRSEEFVTSLEGSAATDSESGRSGLDLFELDDAIAKHAEPVRPGYAAFQISDDEMTATGHFYPPEGTEAPIELEAVERQLEQLGVVYGIDREALQNAIWSCNSDGREVLDVPVARGSKPTDAMAAHIGLRKELTGRHRKNRKSPDSPGRIDYREQSPFVIVSEGTVLARDIPRREGKPGYTVLGTELPPKTITPRSWKPGPNVTRKGKYYRAAVDGRFEWSSSEFRVNKVLEVHHEVDYSTGHIDFPGDVILHKAVRDRFRVHAEGSVLCMETLDASDVRCGGDLIARRGIIGRNEATLFAGGDIETRYIENCRVSARGDVRANAGIVNSVVNSLGAIRTGKEGIIVGGELCALAGVEAQQIGSRMGTRTTIRCGVDFEAAERLARLQERSTEIVFRLQEVRNRIAQHPERAERLSGTKEKLETALQRLQDTAPELLNQLDKDESATVRARRRLHAGVYIEICHVGYQTTYPLPGAILKLNKFRGAIEVETGAR